MAVEKEIRRDPFESDTIPQVYFNGFGIGTANADFSLVLQTDNVPKIHLKASYTTMKTFALQLSAAVANFEKLTKHNLMTTDEVLAALESGKDANASKSVEN